MTGTISNLITNKRFGFISGENGQEYFFHESDSLVDWNELISEFNQHGGGKIQVSFLAEKTSKGPRARSVAIIEEE